MNEIQALNNRIRRLQEAIETAEAQNVLLKSICDQWRAELNERLSLYEGYPPEQHPLYEGPSVPIPKWDDGF